MIAILRPGTPADAAPCGAICFEAFKSIASEHNFPWDFPSAEIATGMMKTLLGHAGFYSVVAEYDGKVSAATFSTNVVRLPELARSRSILRRRTSQSAVG